MKLILNLFKLAAFIILIAICIAFYAFRIEPYSLTTKEYSISSDDFEKEFRVVQLSDLEISSDYTEKQLRDIVTNVNLLDPDIVVFTGDLFSNYAKYKPVESVIDALSSLQNKYGKYAVWGNNDYGGGASRVYKELMEESGFQVLKNDGLNITLENGSVIFLAGLDDMSLGNPDIELTMNQKSDDAIYTVLLSHSPNVVRKLRDNSIDVVLSGHTHGGQINIAHYLGNYRNTERYIYGKYKIKHLENTTLYISNGFGTSRIPARFFVPPQIVCLKIVPS